MLCQKCNHNNASVHYEQNINGKVTKLDLCPECAKEMNLGIGNIFDTNISNAFGNMFDDVFESFGSLLGSHAGTLASLSCNSCGTSLNDLSNTSFLGCPDCYDVFDSLVEKNLERCQRGTRHLGKRPNRLGSPKAEESKKAKKEKKPLSEADSLRAELKAAVKAENYEKAAELRDKIKALENKEDGDK
ncbi:MAG: UvrB/UvrC motif-containing protein [Clostridiales bacterium]|nr:UvrB/UvrC motif-containing protein [Clostridiales bacterium]